MTDGLPRLLPSDPQNLLSVEARKRIQRALIESDKFIWKAEVEIEKQSLERRTLRAHPLRNKACFEKARAVLSVYRKEFSQLGLPDRQYRQIMHDEIDSASSSLQLSGAQCRLLETEFFYQEDQPAHRASVTTSHPPPARSTATAESVAAQIDRLRKECRLTAEELAELIGLEPRSVFRHLAGDSVPYAKHIRAYEREFSKLLKRQVVISKLS
jgi:hypothetical protein